MIVTAFIRERLVRNRTLLSIASFFTAFSIYHFISIPFDELPPLPGYFLSVIAQLCVAVFIYLFATKLTKLLAVITLSFLFVPIFSLISNGGNFHWDLSDRWNSFKFILIDDQKFKNNTPVSDPIVATKTKPNIFIFLFDGYQRSDILKKFYGYDNSEFCRNWATKGSKLSTILNQIFQKLRKV